METRTKKVRSKWSSQIARLVDSVDRVPGYMRSFIYTSFADLAPSWDPGCSWALRDEPRLRGPVECLGCLLTNDVYFTTLAD